MPVDIPRRSGASIRTMRRELAEASTPQLLKIVATVDAVADRGDADQLISPIRQRLTALQPPRRLRFNRLLFYPLDPLIVPAARWRPSQPLMPRTALPVIAAGVRTALGSATGRIDAEIEGRSTADIDVISRIGRTLWPAAAKALIGMPPPDSWSETGLNPKHFTNLAGMAAGLLGQATALADLCKGSVAGLAPPSADAVHAILRDVAEVSAAAVPMMVCLMLIRLPEVAVALEQPTGGPQGALIRSAFDQASEVLLEQLDTDGPESRIAAGTLQAAGASARNINALLGQIETRGKKTADKGRLDQIRARLDAACKKRFTAEMEQGLLAPLRQLTSPPASAPMQALEATARGLRVLETEARTVGSGGAYDAMLSQASGTLKVPAMAEQLGLADRMRLVEILEGPDAALALMDDRE